MVHLYCSTTKWHATNIVKTALSDLEREALLYFPYFSNLGRRIFIFVVHLTSPSRLYLRHRSTTSSVVENFGACLLTWRHTSFNGKIGENFEQWWWIHNRIAYFHRNSKRDVFFSRSFPYYLLIYLSTYIICHCNKPTEDRNICHKIFKATHSNMYNRRSHSRFIANRQDGSSISILYHSINLISASCFCY